MKRLNVAHCLKPDGFSSLILAIKNDPQIILDFSSVNDSDLSQSEIDQLTKIIKRENIRLEHPIGKIKEMLGLV